MFFAAEIEYINLIFKTMLKENQRVIDLSNVDTNEKAFILGVQCGFQFGNKSIDYLEHGILRVKKDWRYTDYNIFKDFVEREFDATVKSYDNERIKNGFIERAQRKCYDIDINEYRWVRCYRYYNAYIRITPQSRCYINESLPMLKKDFYPYLLFGIFYNSGNIYNGVCHFLTSKRAAKTLKKQLKNWYDIDAAIATSVDMGHFACVCIKNNGSIEKFFDILPKDYIEIFKEKWSKNEDFKKMLCL